MAAVQKSNAMSAKIREAMSAVEELKRLPKGDSGKAASLLQKMTSVYSDIMAQVNSGDMDMTEDQLEDLQNAVAQLSTAVQGLDGMSLAQNMINQSDQSSSVDELASLMKEFAKSTDSRLKKLESEFHELKKRI